ncbi:hypothetical protein AAVH_27449 [Aphelenchoides avenae]|nr:hypothetical protein AAVH_27449 [Aphelenchus avenae]
MSKNTSYPYVQIFGENDEEEPLKLNIWGKAATEMFLPIVKAGGLYKFTGVRVGATKPQFMYGHLPFDLHLYEWGNVELLRGDYKTSGLPLKSPGDINPSTDWRIRCRGVILQNFTRYMRSVPMAYINAFTKDAEVELVGHISLNGSVWDFDVMKWSDVRNSSTMTLDNTSIPPFSTASSAVEKTPPTPQMPPASRFDFDPSSAMRNHHAPSETTSTGSADRRSPGNLPQTPTSTFVGFQTDLRGMVLQVPRWNEAGNYFNFLVSVSHGGKPKVISVVSARMLVSVANDLKRGSSVYLTGEVVNRRRSK